MARYFLFALLLLTIHHGRTTAPAQSVQCDRECVKTVRELLKEHNSGFNVSWLEKANEELGDSVSVGLQKIYPEKNISAPKTVRLFLPIMLESFRVPGRISKPEHRTPTATLQLLTRLKRKVRDASVRKEITETMDEIINLTSYTSSNRPLQN